MLIIGCDYHPSIQQIAWVDTETGECGERRLTHSAAEPQPKHFGKLSAVSAQLSALGHKCIADILLQSAK